MVLQIEPNQTPILRLSLVIEYSRVHNISCQWNRVESLNTNEKMFVFWTKSYPKHLFSLWWTSSFTNGKSIMPLYFCVANQEVYLDPLVFIIKLEEQWSAFDQLVPDPLTESPDPRETQQMMRWQIQKLFSYKILFTLVANISKLYQGDIELDPELEEYIKTGGNSRNAIRQRKRLWTSRIIPYRIPSYMSMYA